MYEDVLTYQDKTKITSKKQLKKRRIPLVVTYSKNLPNIRNIIKKNMKILHQSDKMKEIFNECPMVAYKKDRTLEDILVHRKTN